MKNIIIAILALAVVVVLGVYLNSLDKNPVGASSSNEHYNPEYFYNSLALGPTSAPGTTIEEITCATASRTFGSIAGNATSSFEATLTGADWTAAQTYWGSIATSSAARVKVHVAPSSTANTVLVTIQNLGSVWNVVTSTYNLCYLQF